VHVEQTRRGERPTWKVAADTVAAIPDLYAEFGYGPLGEWLPPVFFELQVLDVQLWQWIALLVLAAVALPLSWVAVWLIVLLTRPLVRRTRHLGDDWTREVAEQPLRLILAVSIFTGPAYLIGLSIPAQRFFAAVEKATIVIGIAWLIARAIDLGARMLTRQLGANGRAPAVSFVPLGQRALKGLLAGLALLAVLQNFGVNVTGILAGLGIGGLAVALAAQKTVENLFGGVMLFFDQPVRVGDFCRFGSQLGTVEYIGMRSTQVRTLDRTVVSVPNAEFAQMQLENFGKRDRIRFIHTIGLRYETTPDQLRHVLVELKRLLARHPKIDPDPARPRFVSFGAHSLDIEVFAYVLTSDINEYLAIQEDLLLRIMELVAASGTGFAFPSQTIYTAADTGLDGDRTRTAEERVHKWREENALPLPTFPPAELVKIARTLDYPAKGSATAQR
jgi:MscS family membrane protein